MIIVLFKLFKNLDSSKYDYITNHYKYKVLLVILKPSLIIFYQIYFHVKQYPETLLQPYLIIYPSFCLLPTCFQINQVSWNEIGQNSTKKILFLITLKKNWLRILQLDQQNMNLSMESYLDHANSVLDIHLPFKKVNKYKLRFKIKPWIIPTFRKHISAKNSLLKKFINCNDFQTKEHLHCRY